MTTLEKVKVAQNELLVVYQEEIDKIEKREREIQEEMEESKAYQIVHGFLEKNPDTSFHARGNVQNARVHEKKLEQELKKITELKKVFQKMHTALIKREFTEDDL